MMIKRDRPVRRPVGGLPPTHANRPTLRLGRPKQQDNYILLTNEIADLKSQIKRSSRINWIVIGLDWVIKIVFFWV